MKKAQVFSLDLIIAFFLFFSVLFLFFKYGQDLSKISKDKLNEMTEDINFISNSLVSKGYPDSWNAENVISIGVTDNNQKINRNKLVSFSSLNYNTSKKLLNTNYDYLIFFENKSRDKVGINGVCYIGKLTGQVNITYNLSFAYYYYDEDDFLMKDIMEERFSADIYCRQQLDCDLGDIDDLLEDVEDYDVIVIEDGKINKGGRFGERIEKIEDFLEAGGFLIFSEDITTADETDLLGITYRKWQGQSEPEVNATVVDTDPFLSLNRDDNIVFTQAGYVQNNASENFNKIAEFYGTGGAIDGEAAIARWDSGNGIVFYFADFDANILTGDFADIVRRAILAYVRCKGDIQLIGIENLIKAERFLLYDNELIRMIIYLFE